MRPQRIQRKRTAGWRMPEGAIYVGRPTKWGNPFQFGHRQYGLVAEPGIDGREWDYEGRISAAGMRHDYHLPGGRVISCTVRLGTRAEMVELYRLTLAGEPTARMRMSYPSASGEPGRFLKVTPADVRAELAGKDLACFCPLDMPCHASVLLDLANGEAP